MIEAFPNAVVSEGYGSTEVGTITINDKVAHGVKYRLRDLPHMGYFSTGDPPRGEILIKAYKTQFSG